jgi:hypothetical protein
VQSVESSIAASVLATFGRRVHHEPGKPAGEGKNGFRIKELKTGYIPGWRPASFRDWATATLQDLDIPIKKSI